MHNLLLDEAKFCKLFRPEFICDLRGSKEYTGEKDRNLAVDEIRNDFKLKAKEVGGIAVIIEEPIFLGNGTKEVHLTARVYKGDTR